MVLHGFLWQKHHEASSFPTTKVGEDLKELVSFQWEEHNTNPAKPQDRAKKKQKKEGWKEDEGEKERRGRVEEGNKKEKE